MKSDSCYMLKAISGISLAAIVSLGGAGCDSGTASKGAVDQPPENTQGTGVEVAPSPHALQVLKGLRERFSPPLLPEEELQKRGKAGAEIAARAKQSSLFAQSPVQHLFRKGQWLVPGFADKDMTGLPYQTHTQVALPDNATGAFQLKHVNSGMTLKATLRGMQDAKAELADGFVMYRGAHESGAHLLHRMSPSGTEDYLAFDAAPARTEVQYDVELSARVAGLRQVHNSLEFLDSGGAPRMRIAAPYLVDSNGAHHSAQLGLSGCQADTSLATPWGRQVTPPGAGKCLVRISWENKGVVYPAVLDPAWQSTGNMQASHNLHTATRLDPNGRVVVIGGADVNLNYCDINYGWWACNNPTVFNGPTTVPVEVFDPATYSWAAAGSTDLIPRWQHSATLLSGGTILVAGGAVTAGSYGKDVRQPGGQPSPFDQLLVPTGLYDLDGSGNVTGRHPENLPSPLAQIYNPADGTTTDASPPDSLFDPGATGDPDVIFDNKVPFLTHVATQLTNGKVLFVFGQRALLYNPSSSQWTAAANPPSNRGHETLTQGGDGKVYRIGGKTPLVACDSGTCQPPAAAIECYDPNSDIWTSLSGQTLSLYGHTASLLPGGTRGQVLLVAGLDWAAPVQYRYPFPGTTLNPTTYAFDVATQTVSPALDATTCGGGYGGFSRKAAASIRTTDTGADAGTGVDAAPAADAAPGTDAGTGADAGTGTDAGTGGASHCDISSQVIYHTTTVLPTGQVLKVGGNVPFYYDYFGYYGNPVELYDPVARTWTNVNGTNNFHEFHTATVLKDNRVLIADSRIWFSSSYTTPETYSLLTSPTISLDPPPTFGGGGYGGYGGRVESVRVSTVKIFNSGPNSDNDPFSTTVTASGADPGSTVTVTDSLNGQVAATYSGTADANGTFVQAIVVTGAGTHQITATQAATRLGIALISNPSDAVIVNILAVPTADPPVVVANNNSVTLTGTAAPGASVCITDQTTGDDFGCVTADSNGHYSFPITFSQGGQHTLGIVESVPNPNGRGFLTSQADTVTVNLTDTIPPVLSVPGPVAIKVNTQGGAALDGSTVIYATDNFDSNPNVTCSTPANSVNLNSFGSGTYVVDPTLVFPLGTTTITCIANDASGNTSGPLSFTVTVNDVRPTFNTPKPPDISVATTSKAGAVVVYPLPTATSILDGTATVTCVPPSGYFFPAGTVKSSYVKKTQVKCTTTDSAGTTSDPNDPNSTFLVTVTYVPPTGTGTISGTVYGSTGTALIGAPVDVCQTDATGMVMNCPLSGLRSNTSGQYTASGLPGSATTPVTYIVKASPPAGVTDLAAVAPMAPAPNLLINTANQTITQDIHLTHPNPPPPMASVQPTQPFSIGGLPVIHWQSTETLKVQGCVGGSASFTITCLENNSMCTPGHKIVDNQAMSPDASLGPGWFSAIVPPVFPYHGPITITFDVVCSGVDSPTTVNLYIDPSGTVQTLGGHPVLGATVTLARGDDDETSATFGQLITVPNGSAIMSTANRVNPFSTGTDGKFAWDVIKGQYQVQAMKDGCGAPFATGVFDIPPPVTGLVLPLACPEPPVTTPVVTVPGSVTVVADSKTGMATVSLTGISAVDDADGPIDASALSCLSDIGTFVPGTVQSFPVGTHTVTCFATNVSQQTGSASFTLNVLGTAPTVALTPTGTPNPTAEAKDANGGPLNYASALSANGATKNCTVSSFVGDQLHASSPPPANLPSGSTFPLGTTQFTCTATNGNQTSLPVTFYAQVKDTTPPRLALPGTIKVEATGGTGTMVTYTTKAIDSVDGVVTPPTCTMPSGSMAPMGQTMVSCTGADITGNAATGTFMVNVVDTTAPKITVGNPAALFTTSGTKKMLSAYYVTAADLVDGNVTPKCIPALGTLYTPGTKISASCTAKDAHGNLASKSFSITAQ